MQALTGALHLKNEWRRYEGYRALQNTFWSTFQDEMRDLSAEIMKIIMTVRVMRLLRSRDFTKWLANMSSATFIRENETGCYNMLFLNDFLINPVTRFDDLN